MPMHTETWAARTDEDNRGPRKRCCHYFDMNHLPHGTEKILLLGPPAADNGAKDLSFTAHIASLKSLLVPLPPDGIPQQNHHQDFTT